ncbi:hypothetical protein NUW58_g1198 [Xylaria curta]|uniref:Uncharacterized protein n=1 Tax=Xylaria curta TaxID=42375 RepID=A0ACC1PLH3_9PEZI|nr:hypothetical protein NUW58_g1198 [Xylaria curta]
MASHHKENTSVTVTPVHSSEGTDACIIVASSSEATTVEIHNPKTLDPLKNWAGSEVGKQENAGLTSVTTASPHDPRAIAETAEITIPVRNVREVNSVTIETNDAESEDANSSGQEEKSADIPLATKKHFITMQHYEGGSFRLPWDLCRTSKGMENLIKVTYVDKAAKRDIENGDYEIFTVDGDRVIPDWWEMLVQPEWKVVIRLASQGLFDNDSSPDAVPDPGSSSDVIQSESKEKEEKFETIYTPKVTYTVTYYTQKMNSEESILICNLSYDDPVVLERWDNNSQELPILEEKVLVTIPWSRSNEYHRDTLGGKPKLGVDDEVNNKSLHIHSPFLLNALRSIIKYSATKPSGSRLGGFEDGEFPYPYADLFYHIQDLLDYKNDTTGPRDNHTPGYNAECDRHIDFLLDYLEKEPTIQHKLLEDRWAKKTPTTTFSGFWLLMKPGSDVYVEEYGQLNAYVVDRISGGVKSAFQGPLALLRRQVKAVEVPVFDNEKDILSLPLFPARFQDDKDGGARKKQLIDRGKKVFRFVKRPTFLEYTGLGLRPGQKKYNRARVVVEHESQPWRQMKLAALRIVGQEEDPFDPTFKWVLPGQKNIGERARRPRCECSECGDIDAVGGRYRTAIFSDYDGINPKERSELSEHQSMLCMSHMFGFILKDRKYDLLDVGCLSDVKIVENAIDDLVMRPEANKDTIKAIVKTYADSDQVGLFSADFIQGKGEGQIFLLHGPPGTGKTLTAESVAEYTRRPLLSITAADLGHEPWLLERNLLQFLTNAKNWDAIVLLDEADVYLERRSTNDIRRNSIVSIFLREMDYFQGILFLTTNRVGHFDEAFMSRIHLSIGYHRLDDKARWQIWDNLFRKLKDDHKNGGQEIRYEYEAKEYVKKSEEVKILQWNGREIRNAFQTAVALAIFEANTAKEKGVADEKSIPEVKESHLTQVVSMSTAFKKYITATHQGMDDVDMAFKLGIRDDKTQ